MLSHFFSITDSSAFTSGKSTNLFWIITPSPQCLHFHTSYLSHLSHLSHSSHIFARAARTSISPIPLSLPIPPTIARVAHTPRWRKLAASAQFKIQNSKFIISFAAYTILTIYKRYRKSEQKAKNQRSINI